MEDTTKLDVAARVKLLSSLSPREAEVLNLILRGRRNKEVAAGLFISIKTVEFHIKNIFIKLGVKNRIELINLLFCDESLDWRNN